VIEVRRDAEIYVKEGGWFRARWHFSFDEYLDPANMGLGTLRVFNDDTLVPGAIWPMHPHRDVEGITYVVSGTFRHQDDVGGPPGMLPAGSVQRMTLGRGAWHSEQNGSETEPLRFIQMWIIPAERGLEPGVEQKFFTRQDRTDRLLEVVSGRGGDAVLVHQDAAVYVSSMSTGSRLEHSFERDRGAYLYVIEGAVGLDHERLETGDAARITAETVVALESEEPTELLMVEVGLTG
jgi:hypothetical protein